MHGSVVRRAAALVLGAMLGVVGVSAGLTQVSDAAPASEAAPASSAAPASPHLGAQVGGGGYRWPLDGEPVVTRRFDPPPQRWLPGHRGVDLAAEPGATVRAAGAGTVFFAGTVAGAGVVSIDHPGGLRTTYQPLRATVAAGDRVAAGDPIGVLAAGHAGCSTVACLHWGLRRGEEYLDPLWLLGLGQVRLLPMMPAPVAGAGPP